MSKERGRVSPVLAACGRGLQLEVPVRPNNQRLSAAQPRKLEARTSIAADKR